MSLVDHIATDLQVRKRWVERVVSRAPYAYKVYQIPKKNGGQREIAQPARETKLIQYWLIQTVLSKLPIHEKAMAYVPGRSIKQNAMLHKDNKYLAKFDIRNFFTSIRHENIVRFFRSKTEFSDNDINIICRVLTRKTNTQKDPFVSIGAPSSPALSNLIMYDFDQEISAYCQPRGIGYSRYADDMTFSTREKGMLFELPQVISYLLENYPYGNFSLNSNKTIFLSQRNSRRVTGLVITNDHQISLGRKRKRQIRSMIFRFAAGNIENSSIAQLKGLIAFANDVEPLFIKRMEKRYGHYVIEAIMKTPVE